MDDREALVLAHLDLVRRIACRYVGYGLPLADLTSEGNLGLLRAAELYDPKFGTAFVHYASVWITQRIHRAITAQARVVRIPVWRSQRLRKLDRLHAELNAELGRDADFEELGKRVGMDESTLVRITEDRLQIDSLDAAGEDEFPLTDDRAGHPADRLSQEERMEEAIACLEALDDDELRILTLKYGLLDQPEQSYREMAPRFGRSREWIRRLGEGALAKLRASLHTLQGLPRSVVRGKRDRALRRARRISEKNPPKVLSLSKPALIPLLETLFTTL